VADLIGGEILSLQNCPLTKPQKEHSS